MALYRGMDIGTAKPTAAELQLVPHHLVDILSRMRSKPGPYLEAAAGVVAEIAARGHWVLLVGGTPLYLKGLLRGIFEGPPADLSLRHGLREQALLHPRRSAPASWPRWTPRPPAACTPNDTRRLIRALEVQAITGVPISRWQRQFDSRTPRRRLPRMGARLGQRGPDRRIEARVDAMFAAGLVAEVAAFWSLAPLEPYRPAGGRISRGNRTPARPTPLGRNRAAGKTAHAAIGQTSADLARSLSECRFLPVAEPLAAADVVERILRKAESQ